MYIYLILITALFQNIHSEDEFFDATDKNHEIKKSVEIIKPIIDLFYCKDKSKCGEVKEITLRDFNSDSKCTKEIPIRMKFYGEKIDTFLSKEGIITDKYTPIECNEDTLFIDIKSIGMQFLKLKNSNKFQFHLPVELQEQNKHVHSFFNILVVAYECLLVESDYCKSVHRDLFFLFFCIILSFAVSWNRIRYIAYKISKINFKDSPFKENELIALKKQTYQYKGINKLAQLDNNVSKDVSISMVEVSDKGVSKIEKKSIYGNICLDVNDLPGNLDIPTDQCSKENKQTKGKKNNVYM
jgi:hypothetical protein